MSGERLLVLAPFPPRLDAPHGAAKAIASVLVPLAERRPVAVVYLRREDDAAADEMLLARCEIVEEVRVCARQRGLRRARRNAAVAGGLVAGRPAWVAECGASAFAERAAQIARSWRPDIVQAELPVMSEYALRVPPPCIRILVEHDPPTAAELSITAPRLLAPPLRRLDARAWRLYERGSLPRFDAVVVFTERDREVVSLLGARRVETIPLAAEVAAAPTDPLGSGPPTILFFGSFRHAPNVDAAARLIERIFPRVRERVPEAQLEIVGERPPAKLAARAGPGVAIRGFVPDIESQLQRAAVVAAPVTGGGGMRMKILQTLANGKALVASPLALQGLDLQAGREAVVAHSDADFVDALCILLRDPGRRLELARAAGAWAGTRGWGAVAASYERLYDELARPGQRGTCA